MSIIGYIPICQFSVTGIEVKLSQVVILISLIHISKINWTSSFLIFAGICPGTATFGILPARGADCWKSQSWSWFCRIEMQTSYQQWEQFHSFFLCNNWSPNLKWKWILKLNNDGKKDLRMLILLMKWCPHSRTTNLVFYRYSKRTRSLYCEIVNFRVY